MDREPIPVPTRHEQRSTWPMAVVRYGIPGAAVLGGMVVMSLGGSGNAVGGAGIVGAGIAVFLLNLLFRVGVAGDREREAEDAARAFFDRHGHWPDEPPSPKPRRPVPPAESG